VRAAGTPSRSSINAQRSALRALVVAGDKAARYEEILKVMDTLQGNGITRIGLLVQTAQTAKPAR
jgi:biopolymer transport protein TolR